MGIDNQPQHHPRRLDNLAPGDLGGPHAAVLENDRHLSHLPTASLNSEKHFERERIAARFDVI